MSERRYLNVILKHVFVDHVTATLMDNLVACSACRNIRSIKSY